MSDKLYTLEEIREKVKPIAAAYGFIDKGKVKGFAFGGLINALLDAFGKNVDVVTTASLDREFLQEIAGEEVLLHA